MTDNVPDGPALRFEVKVDPPVIGFGDVEPVMTFGVTRGDKGDKGDKGDQGVPGPQGPPAPWVELTQAQYDALSAPDPATLYLITG